MNTDNLSTPADPQQEIAALKESYGLLKEENDKNAIAFAEWTARSRWKLDIEEEGIWYLPPDNIWIPDERIPSSELYEMWKNFLKKSIDNNPLPTK